MVGDSLTAPIAGVLTQRLEQAGWHDVRVDGVPGRVIPASAPPPRSGVAAVMGLKASGFDPPGWIVALGTNDVSESGDADALRARIGELLAAIGPHQVLWVNVWRGDTPEAERRALRFNAVLEDVASRRENLHILDWARTAERRPELFGPDKVHFNSRGDAERVREMVDGAVDALT